MCRGFYGPARQVQHVLGQDPFSRHLLVFRSRRGEGAVLGRPGPVLFAKRLERGRSVWPSAQNGVDDIHAGTVIDAAGRDRLAHADA
ncbi:MAG: IS66 family insertion sequence element accessory protein TnpB [Acidobacteriaceae bacterium]|nr:IS66 family insertion sequence element accessory protein TnpB [Acidobacteriaceae bacterium]